MDATAFIPFLAPVALILVMLSFGLKARAREVFATMCDAKLVLRGILAVNVVPVVAVIVCLLLPIDHAVKIGIVVMSISPYAPILPARMRHGSFRTSQAVGLYLALMLIAVFLLPLAVAILSALFPADASVPIGAMAKIVVATILAPISIGMAIRTWSERFAEPLSLIASIAGFAALALLVVLVLYSQGLAMIRLLGNGSIIAIALTVTSGTVAGHILGRPNPDRSNALAVVATIRHPGIAALIVRSNFEDARIMPAVVLVLLTSVAVTAAYQYWLRGPAAEPLLS